MQISFTPEFADRLRRDMSIEDSTLHNPHGGGNTYTLERALEEDMLVTSVGWANSYYQEANSYVDEWGIGWTSKVYETPFGKGRYTEIARHPLAEDDAILSYRAPDPARLALYKEAETGHSRLQKRLFHRGRDCHDHLRGGVGAAWIAANACRLRC